jgi:hypothetical protein
MLTFAKLSGLQQQAFLFVRDLVGHLRSSSLGLLSWGWMV